MIGTPWTGDGLQLGGLNLDGFEPDTGVKWGVNTFDGWGAKKGTLELVQKPRGAGAWAGDSFATARTIVAAGWMTAPTTLAAADALDRLNASVSLEPALLTAIEGGRPRSLSVRRSDDVIPTKVRPLYYLWSIQVAAEDPRKFGTTLTGQSTLPSTTGGLTIPFTLPRAINAVLATGQVTLVNPGNETGPVQLRIDGPTTGPIITHRGSKLALTFSSSLVLGVGEWLDIDMEKRTVLANGQASRSKFITSRGWSGFEPGENTWSFTAAAYNPASLLTVSATPAWQ